MPAEGAADRSRGREDPVGSPEPGRAARDVNAVDPANLHAVVPGCEITPGMCTTWPRPSPGDGHAYGMLRLSWPYASGDRASFGTVHNLFNGLSFQGC